MPAIWYTIPFNMSEMFHRLKNLSKDYRSKGKWEKNRGEKRRKMQTLKKFRGKQGRVHKATSHRLHWWRRCNSGVTGPNFHAPGFAKWEIQQELTLVVAGLMMAGMWDTKCDAWKVGILCYVMEVMQWLCCLSQSSGGSFFPWEA